MFGGILLGKGVLEEDFRLHFGGSPPAPEFGGGRGPESLNRPDRRDLGVLSQSPGQRY